MREMFDLIEFKKKVEGTRTYKAITSCLNCGQGNEYLIPRGQTVRSFNPECSNCGCKIVEVAKEFER